MLRTNTVKKKKVFKPYKNLGDLYTEAVQGEPSISRVASPVEETVLKMTQADMAAKAAAERDRDLAATKAYNDSRPTSPFDENYLINSTTPVKWPNYTGEYYNTKNLGDLNKHIKGIAGPGELSVSMLIVQSCNTEKFNTDRAKVEAPALRGVNHRQGLQVDVWNEYTDQRYEVKQASKDNSVLVGAHATGSAAELQREIRTNFLALYYAYKFIDIKYKQILNNITVPDNPKPQFQSLKEIFETGFKYFTGSGTGNRGELSRGCVLPVSKMRSHIPQLYRLSLYLTPELLNNKNYIAGEKDTAFATEFYKLQYKVNDSDAITLDNLVKDYVRRKRQLSEQAEADVDKQTFSDFLSIARESPIFAPGKFKTEVQAYFEPGTNKSKETLMTIFPYDGIFVVDPTGYLYAGKNRLHELLRIDCISNNTLKVLPVSAETSDIPIPTDVDSQ